MNKRLSYKLEDLPSVAEKVLEYADEDSVIIFKGDLGAGKTTLIKEICSLLGVDGQVSSPTYSLINEYETEDGPVYHMDLYRLKDIDEALDIGIEDYLHSEEYCLIEWPELIIDLLPFNYTRVYIKHFDEMSRILEMNKVKFD